MIKYKNYSNISQNAQKIHFPTRIWHSREVKQVRISTIRISHPNVNYIRVTPSNLAKTHSQKYVRANTYICITRLTKSTSNSNSPQNSDLFQKKNYQKRVLFRDFTALFPSGPGSVHLKQCVKSLMCGSNWASYIPPSRNFTFFLYFLWNPAIRAFHTPTGFHFWVFWKGEIPRISKEGSEMPRGPEGGMCDAKFEPNITHFRKFCLEKNFWKCSKSLNYWKKKVFQKMPLFWGN